MSMRNVRWVEDVLSRNGGDRELNDVLKVMAKFGYEKVEPLRVAEARPDPHPTPEQFAKEVKHVLGRPDSRFHEALKECLRSVGYVNPGTPRKAEDIQSFANRVDTALSDPLSIFHADVKAVVLNRGYYLPQAANPNVFEIDLTGIPKHLQEVFKVHVDLMFGGLVAGEKKQMGVELLTWDHESFNAGDALDMVFKNILKGHMADASNFLMFINARGWDISPTLFKRHLPQLPWGEETITVNPTKLAMPVVPRKGSKKPNTGFYTMTHGREVPDGYVGQVKDELYEGKLLWIRAVPGYDDLFNILALAYDQAARGKGKERHANNKPFDKQPIIELADKYGNGFLRGQAAKKLEESMNLVYGSDVKELLGAIVYTCAAIMHLEMEAEREAAFNPDEDF